MSTKIASRWVDVDINECVEKVNGRFDLIIIAAAKMREVAIRHNQSQASEYTENKYNHISALLDVQAGKVGREYLQKSVQMRDDEKARIAKARSKHVRF